MAIASQTGHFAASQVTKRLERLAHQIRLARQSHDAESVHDLRVAIRRFTQALIVFQPSFAPKEAKKIRRRLKDTMTLAGEVRDCDIALKYLSGWRSPDAAALRGRLQNRRREAHAALLAGLKRWVLRKTSAKWRDRLEVIQDAGAGEMARRELPRITRAFFKWGDRAADAKASAEDLHQLRIAAKKFRYTLELFASFYGPAANDRIERIAGVQALLGRINDCRAVRTLVAQLGDIPRLEASLKKRQRRKTDEFRQLWTAEFSGDAKLWLQALQRPPRKPMRSASSSSGRRLEFGSIRAT